jgi:hypothetical protein
MAKIHSDLLLKKYYFDHKKNKAFYYNPITKKVSFDEPAKQQLKIEPRAKTYQELTNEILANNLKKISARVLKLNEESWRKALNRISTEETKHTIPDINEILNKSNLQLLKVQERGKLIKNTLKNALTRKLRETYDSFTGKTGEPSYLIRRGKTTGKINNKLVQEFQNRITEVFQSYTVRNPKFNVPSNIKTIAVTEIRSIINPLKKIYADNLIAKNRNNLEFYKTWIHNAFLSKVPRRGHLRMNNVKISYNAKFRLPIYKKLGKRFFITHYLECNHPHDESLPLSEKIGCNCDWIITAKRI